MPRYSHPPITLDALQQDGPPVRMRDLVALSGLASPTIRAEIAAGHLAAHRLAGVGYWLVARVEARRWLAEIGVGEAA
jgi:hypothetical protein